MANSRKFSPSRRTLMKGASMTAVLASAPSLTGALAQNAPAPAAAAKGPKLLEMDGKAKLAVLGDKPLVAETPLQPHARHAWDLPSRVTATHVRLNIFPDGGVARLRLFGAVQG